MPTTSNFGWTTPADTDLVKDGAAAIRTLGNGIDTSLVDLKGGTTGQNLRKASNTDLDFTFAGDATNTVVDAAGDLLYGTANDTLGRLAIGTAGQVLKVNSGATAPEWGAAASAFVGCSVYKSGTQSLANNTAVTINWENEHFDTDAFHSTVTNTSRITIPSGKNGKYLFSVTVGFTANATGNRYFRLDKNGSSAIVLVTHRAADSTNQSFHTASAILNLVATDYIEVIAFQNSGGSLDVRGASADESLFSVQYLGA